MKGIFCTLEAVSYCKYKQTKQKCRATVTLTTWKWSSVEQQKAAWQINLVASSELRHEWCACIWNARPLYSRMQEDAVDMVGSVWIQYNWAEKRTNPTFFLHSFTLSNPITALFTCIPRNNVASPNIQNEKVNYYENIFSWNLITF